MLVCTHRGMLLRVRATAFLSGAAVAGAFAIFKLRQDLLDSQEVLLDQVSSPGGTLLWASS